MGKLAAREKIALLDAAKRPGGWGRFNPKTTAKLAEKGFFVLEKHPSPGYGVRYRITNAGRAALENSEESMPNDMSPPQALVRASNADLQTMPIADAVEAYSPQFDEALPDNIPLQRFKRTVLTALNMSPELARADRRSLFNACVKCAHDGLYPDGREAALVIFNTKVKRDGQDVWIKAVQYLPMIAGIRKRMRNSGEVTSAEARVVYENDTFHYQLGENPQIVHEPAAMMAEPGRPVGAYAIIKLKNGEVLREIMRFTEIERVRAFSKTGDNDGSPWKTSWAEMARKTVLKRCAKAAPNDAEIERLFNRDDEYEPAGHALPPPPRPEPAQFIEHKEEEQQPEPAPETPEPYEVINAHGEVIGFETPNQAHFKLIECLTEAATLGKDRLDGVWEDNTELVKQLIAAFPDMKHLPVQEKYTELLQAFNKPPEPPTRPRGRPRKDPAAAPAQAQTSPSEPPAWVTDEPGAPLAQNGSDAQTLAVTSAGGSPIPPSISEQQSTTTMEEPTEETISNDSPNEVDRVEEQSTAEQPSSAVDTPAAPAIRDDEFRVHYVKGMEKQAYVAARKLIDDMRARQAQPAEYKRFREINEVFLKELGNWAGPFFSLIDKSERGE